MKKPFAAVSVAIDLRKKFTPRGMRRTFNDAAREANLGPLLTRSISGHQTDRMHEHYSTVTAEEQRQGIGNVFRLIHTRPTVAPSGGKGGGKAPQSGGSEGTTIH